jgi:AcrR family transcriptional regulator
MILRQLLTAVTYSAEALETERDKIIIVHDNVLFYTLIILSEILKINQQYYVKCRGKNANKTSVPEECEMNQDSQRVTETKDRIKEAFFDLYETKKIEKISIKEITEKANLNRGTFYVYYKDIYDLLEKAEDEFLEELVNKIKGVAIMILRGGDIHDFMPPLSFYEKYGRYLKVLLGNNGDPNFVYKIKNIVKKTLHHLMQQENLPIVPRTEYVMEYMASAQIGLITFWIQRDLEVPIEEMGELIREISLHGPVGYIKGCAGKESIE